MAWDYVFRFFRENGTIDKGFVENIVEVLQNAECQYLKQYGYWSNEKDDLVLERPLEEAIEVTSIQGGGCLAGIQHRDGLDFMVHLHSNKLGMLEVTLSVHRVYLFSTTIEEDIKNANILLNISEKLYDFLHPFYAYADHENERPEDEELISKDIKHIYWANFFSPEIVKKIGKEKLLSAPSWKTKKLKDGGILLVLGPLIYKEEGEEVEKYLGFRE